MELQLGKMTNAQLAQWFGIKEGTFKSTKAKKLEELKLFADFYEDGGKVYITEIYEPVYNKEQGKTLRKVVNKIDKVWDKSGLDTCRRVGTKICNMLNQEGIVRSERTIIEYTRQGRDELYGKPFTGTGPLGCCVYTWCKKDGKTGEFRLLDEKEQKIKEDLQKKYFGDATEKVVIVKAMVEAGEIKKELAWDYLEYLISLTNNNFYEFLCELQAKLGCQVIRGTLVTRNAFVLEEEKIKEQKKIGAGS